MASISRPLVFSGLKYGLVGGAMIVILFLVLYFQNENPLTSYTIDSIILALFLFVTIKEVRDYHQRGNLTFSQGMTAGFITYLSVALISALFIFIFLKFIDPGVLEKHIPENLSNLTEDPQSLIERYGEEGYQKAIEGVKNQTAWDAALFDFIRKVGIGLLLTSIISLFFKK